MREHDCTVRAVGGGSEELEVGGLRIAFERTGDGPPLVLLHGVLGDSREWRTQLEGLSDDFTVVAWDAPGCGRSADPPESFRLPDYADVLAAFIDALGLGRPHMLGLSFGGGLALELYGRHPHVPRTLILASAYAGWAGSLPPEVVEERLQRAIREAELPPDRFLSRWQSELLTDAASHATGAELMAIMSDYHPAGFLTMAYAFAEADLRDVLPRIDVPVLLLYGDEDRRSPPDIGRDLAAQIPSARLVVLPGAGHMCNMEAPERFNAEIRGFLAGA